MFPLRENPPPSPFFPETLKYVRIMVPNDTAYHCIKYLADFGNFHLIDTRQGESGGERHHASALVKAEDSSLALDYIESELKNFGVLYEPPTLDPYYINYKGGVLTEAYESIKSREHDLREKISNYNKFKDKTNFLKRKHSLLKFFRSIIEKNFVDTNIDNTGGGIDYDANIRRGLLGAEDRNFLSSIAGSIEASKYARLSSMISRVSKNNVLMHVSDPVDGFVSYAGVCMSDYALVKIKKVCESFSSEVFEFPPEQEALNALEREILFELEESRNVEDLSCTDIRNFLYQVAAAYWGWRLFITSEKQIWEAIDYGIPDRGSKCTIYSGFCPERFIDDFNACLTQATNDSQSVNRIVAEFFRAEDSPVRPIPTFIETNHFTYSFQLMNDSYGVPSYGELNAGVFYCMYPFLFGMMFGDIGHSLFYLLGTIYMFWIDYTARKNKTRLTSTIIQIRNFKWFCFFASICSLYCGLIYNECFGLPISFFKSMYNFENNSGEGSRTGNYVYPFGIDTNWHFAENELLFLNSFKMKLSIVMGMCQMIFGIILSLVNMIKSNKKAEILVTWLPNFLYFVPFFGYLMIIVIIKWLTDKGGWGDESINLIEVMISMILGGSSNTRKLYSGQDGVQKFLVVMLFISIPLCLFAKPIYKFVYFRKTQGFSILEAFIMNLIHVIEFCLSALSHTASYLRLWALSLAHSQLSLVLWNNVFLLTLDMNFFTMFIGFMMYAFMTVAILLGMEGFSALLHAIRLMWVEFSSKFYEGQGVPFKPLSIVKLLEEMEIR